MYKRLISFIILTFSFSSITHAGFISNCKNCGGPSNNSNASKKSDTQNLKQEKPDKKNFKNYYSSKSDQQVCDYITLSDKWKKEAERRKLNCEDSKNNIYNTNTNFIEKKYSWLSEHNDIRNVTVKVGKEIFKTIAAAKLIRENNIIRYNSKVILYNEICDVTSKLTSRGTGNFSTKCPSGYEASGTFNALGSGKGSVGKGRDSLGNEIQYNFQSKLKGKSSKNILIEALKRLDSYKPKFAQKNTFKNKKDVKVDNVNPKIEVFTKQVGSNAIISGLVTDDTEVAELLINGQPQEISKTGKFETKFYLPRTGKSFEIIAYDLKGNKAIKLLKLVRENVKQASGPKFENLNPSSKRVMPNLNAFGLIIGVGNYEKTNAKAIYADNDAKMFYDYATMKLGIPFSNIKELVNEKADESEILLSIQEWLRRSAKPNKSDIYVFFAGHGLASQDGKNMYLLPHDGSPRLLEKTAILRDEMFRDIKQANPRSVTVFLDTCYSGVTRNEEMLIAGRPIVIKAKEQAIPDGFTLFSAASNEQISRPLEEAKHGMFSYFLMKGMEGDADTNNDNKITARELHAYVEQNVVQQSSGSQTPELQGDKDRVLVQFN